MTQRKWQICMLLLIFMFSNASGSGTPSRLDTPVTIYNNEFFEDELQHGLVSGRMMYSLDLHTVSRAVTDAPGVSGRFCVAVSNADQSALMAGLNWACGPGGANCSAIQPGGSCYSNSLLALASYAYNDCYQRTRVNGGTCNFNNTAGLTSTDPSNGSCIFTGSSGTGPNTGGGGSTNTNSSTNPSTGGGGIVPNPSSFGPAPLDNSVLRLEFPKLNCLVVPVMLLFWLKL